MNRNVCFLLWVVLLNLRVNIVGSISITELFVLTQIPKLWKWSNTIDFGLIRTIRNLFFCLIASQCISELILQNTFLNAVKGLMITFTSLFVLLFFLYEIVQKKTSVLMIPLGFILAQIILGDQFGFSESGDSSVWFKFYAVPIITNGICLLFLLNNKCINRNVALIFFTSSILMMVFGSRTGGFTMMLSLILYFLFRRRKKLTKWQVVKILIPMMIAFQLFYALIYVPNIKSGEWGSDQNREQMKAIDYSSNSLMLIMAARSDFYVSFLAFMDAPLWGHGAWALDDKLKYSFILNRLSDGDENQLLDYVDNFGTPLIPAHSVLIGMGTRNGIFAFILFLCITILIYEATLRLLWDKTKDLPFICYLIITSLQAVLFSPPAVLKNYIVVIWAILLAYYYMNYKVKRNETISSHCNL